MAIYTLDGTDKEISVQGRYASVKNNGTETVYASSTPDLDLEAAEVVPIQAGESVVVRDCKKKLYVRGSGQIAVVSGNEPFNFFKPAPKGGGGGSGDGITQQLNDTLKSYATNTGVDEKLAEYLPITDVGYIHVYGLMDTAFINSTQTAYNYEGFSVDGAGIGFPPEYVTYYYIKYISRDDMSGIQFAWDMTNKGWFFYRSYRGSNAVTSWGPWIKLPMMEDIPAIPDSLPADGGNADTVGGYKPGELIQDNPNLLDNPDFRINQRGEGEYTSTSTTVNMYTVDRWKVFANNICIVEEDGLTIRAKSNDRIQIYQYIGVKYEDLAGKKVILSVKFANDERIYYASGIIPLVAPVDQSYIAISQIENGVRLGLWYSKEIRRLVYQLFKSDVAEGNSIKIEWTKLELGSVATPFVPPNPATELLKCQRYYQRLDREMRHIGTGYVLASNTESFSFMAYCPLPTTMRVPGPTVTINGTLYVWVPRHHGTNAFTTNKLTSNITLAQNMLTIPLEIGSTDETLKQSVFGLPGSIQFRDTESYIEISADL